MAAPFNVVFALFPRITQLDFTGPYEVLTRLPGAQCVLASVEGGELAVDSVMRFAGLRRLDSIVDCDLLCVPGGFGTVAAMSWRGLVGLDERASTPIEGNDDEHHHRRAGQRGRARRRVLRSR